MLKQPGDEQAEEQGVDDGVENVKGQFPENNEQRRLTKVKGLGIADNVMLVTMSTCA